MCYEDAIVHYSTANASPLAASLFHELQSSTAEAAPLPKFGLKPIERQR